MREVRRNWRDPSSATRKLIRCDGDGVYCLQYDDEKIISGNRANKIKVAAFPCSCLGHCKEACVADLEEESLGVLLRGAAYVAQTGDLSAEHLYLLLRWLPCADLELANRSL